MDSQRAGSATPGGLPAGQIRMAGRLVGAGRLQVIERRNYRWRGATPQIAAARQAADAAWAADEIAAGRMRKRGRPARN